MQLVKGLPCPAAKKACLYSLINLNKINDFSARVWRGLATGRVLLREGKTERGDNATTTPPGDGKTTNSSNGSGCTGMYA